MKILFFSRDYTTHDRRFLLKLAETEHKVYFLRLENDGIGYENRSVPKGIHVIDWAGGTRPAPTPDSWLKLMPAFEKVLGEIKPDLIHAGPVQSCGFMTALMNFHPFLLMSWGSDILIDADRDDFWRWITDYTLRRADRLVCDSQSVRSKVISLVKYPEKRIVQFPWGIDLRMFSPLEGNSNLRNQLGWEKAFVVLSTRAWQPIYGIEVLLEAFGRAYKVDPRLRLMLLGNGPLEGKVHELINAYGLRQAVYQPGMVSHEHLPEYFRASDLYMSCAYSDGTSISLLEALAMGLPVLVTDIASNREWVTADINGWLGTTGDAAAFSKLLIHAAQLDNDARMAISYQNRELATQRADWDTNISRLLEAYQDMHEEHIGRTVLKSSKR